MPDMAKGKYAARAANARAGEAQERIAELERQIAEEKAAHERQTADLRRQNAQLTARLNREVKELAAAEVQRVNAAAEVEIKRLLAKVENAEGRAAGYRDKWEQLTGGIMAALQAHGFTSTEALEFTASVTGWNMVLDPDYSARFGMTPEQVVAIQRARGVRGSAKPIGAVDAT